MLKKITLILTWTLLILGFIYFDVSKWFTLDYLQTHYQNWISFIHQSTWHFVITALIFFLCYCLITASSLPGAAILTLAAGALFGFWPGLLIVSFASTLGASIAFLTARYLFRARIEKHFQEKLITINRGLDEEGNYYLLSLRLIPIFPFFLINLLMGLTHFSLKRFYLISQLGMLPGTMIYVLAGTEVAQINQLNDIFSLQMLFVFCLLGLFPFIMKKIVNYIKDKQTLKNFSKPKQFDYNLIVIGAGAAGLVSSYIASSVKAKVLLIEKHEMGGDCLNRGCVPSKTLIKSAELAYHLNHASQYGLAETSSFQLNDTGFRHLMQTIQARISQIAPHDSIERYQSLGVEVQIGEAKLLDPWRVQITTRSGEVIIKRARHIILATGSKPYVPPIKQLEHVNWVTTDTLWDHLYQRQSSPKHIIVLGTGPIGVELSQSFARLGIKTTLIGKAGQVLPKEDKDVSQHALDILTDSGVNVILNTTLSAVATTGTIQTNPTRDISTLDETLPYQAILQNNQNTITNHSFDLLIIATGRQAHFTGLGLEALGLDTTKKITPNTYLQLPIKTIFVAGDSAGGQQFTHLAAHHAWYATVNALFGQFKRFKRDESLLPRCTYLDPVIARIGLNEQEAMENNIAYDVTYYEISELDRAIIENATKGFIKILTRKQSDSILGVCIIAKRADDMLNEFTLAMKYNLGLRKVLRTIHPYPTWSEANKNVAGLFQKQRINPKLLHLLKWFHTTLRHEKNDKSQ